MQECGVYNCTHEGIGFTEMKHAYLESKPMAISICECCRVRLFPELDLREIRNEECLRAQESFSKSPFK